MGKQHANDQHQNASLPGCCPKHPPLWQRVMDTVYPQGAQAERFPSTLPPQTPGHHLARPRHQHRRLGQSRVAEHVLHPHNQTHAMVGACHPHGRWTNLQRPPFWQAGERKKTNRTSSPSPQRFANGTSKSDTSTPPTLRPLPSTANVGEPQQRRSSRQGRRQGKSAGKRSACAANCMLEQRHPSRPEEQT